MHKDNLMWGLLPQSVNVLFLFIPSCCRCVRRTEVNLVVLWSTQSNILLLWCWNSDVRKLCSVLFSLCSPDRFLLKLSAFLSHLYCFCCFSFNPTCHFCLIYMYLLPRMCFIWNAYLYSWFSFFLLLGWWKCSREVHAAEFINVFFIKELIIF